VNDVSFIGFCVRVFPAANIFLILSRLFIVLGFFGFGIVEDWLAVVSVSKSLEIEMRMGTYLSPPKSSSPP
jgi:hypothetical protein